MKRYTLLLFLSTLFVINGLSQNSTVFNKVPLVNGKVVFQQFVQADEKLNSDQKYALLYKWCKNRYSTDPLLLGIRYDEKNRSVTVSSKAELPLSGNREKMMMSYRFDAAITDMGCMLTIRDITYQSARASQAYTAEELITDAGMNTGTAEEKELKTATRKATLVFVNGLYNDLKTVFEPK